MTGRATNNESGFSKYVEASFVGAARGLLGLPIEHPLDTIRVRCQAVFSNSPIKMAKQIGTNEGFLGFYSGLIPHASKVALKQMYRYPMMISFPNMYQHILPLRIRKDYPSSVKIATGATIATLETFLVVTPFERLKVYLMTSDKGRHKIRNFFKTYKSSLYHELLRGISMIYARQITSWITFLVWDEKLKNREKQLKKADKLSLPSLIKVGCYVGGLVTIVNMPFDNLKTHLQKKNYDKLVFKTIGNIYCKHGLKGFYFGWQVRAIEFMFQSILTITFLDKLEQSFKRKREKLVPGSH